jgi:hypothetical protein
VFPDNQKDSGMLTAEAIRQKTTTGPKLHKVTVKAWGDEVTVLQEIDGLQSYEWDKASMERLKDDRYAMEYGTGAEHLVRLCLVTCDLDDSGEPVSGTQKRVFADSRADILAVRRLGAALTELYGKCLRINRMRVKDEEETEKNSGPVPSSDSGATSPTGGDAQ